MFFLLISTKFYSRYLMLRLTILVLFTLVITCISAQEPLKHKKQMYTAPDGKLYIQKDLPVYLWLSVDPGDGSEKYRLTSEETSRYANPMYFDAEGYNTVRSPSAVDTITHKTVYPMRDIVFEIYADSHHPQTSIDFGDTKPFKLDERTFLGEGTLISLLSRDALSGVENIYVSVNGSPFSPYTESIPVTTERTYSLKYYAVDNVGNVEPLHEYTLVYDKTPPATKTVLVGDQYENILSGRSKIELQASDSVAGIAAIMYSIDGGPEKKYSSAIPTAYLSQDNHVLSYYATDRVGNREETDTFSFYVDKTPPTIIEEIMGKSFFSGGREYSSGKSRLKLTAFDNKAGVKEVRYSVNSTEYEEYSTPVFLTQSSGNIVIRSYAVDRVNNRSVSQTANEKTSIPYIDLTGPELSYRFSGPVFSSRDTTFISDKTQIVLKAGDSEAGVNRMEYTINGSEPQIYASPFSVSVEGYSEVDYTGFDNVENTSGNAFGFKVDATGPVIKYQFGTTRLKSQGGLNVYPVHTTIFISATDMVVGYAHMTYSINGSTPREYGGVIKGFSQGENSLLIVAYDQLGNTTEEEIKFIID